MLKNKLTSSNIIKVFQRIREHSRDINADQMTLIVTTLPSFDTLQWGVCLVVSEKGHAVNDASIYCLILFIEFSSGPQLAKTKHRMIFYPFKVYDGNLDFV